MRLWRAIDLATGQYQPLPPDLRGWRYLATSGPYQGQVLTVIGYAPIEPERSYLIQTESGQVFGASAERVLATLNAREAQVLQMRFGLKDGHTYTLEEVGRRFGVTRERVRQIEAKALRKLRYPKGDVRMNRNASEQLSEQLGAETWLVWALVTCLRWPFRAEAPHDAWAEAVAEVERLDGERGH